MQRVVEKEDCCAGARRDGRRKAQVTVWLGGVRLNLLKAGRRTADVDIVTGFVIEL